MTPALSRRGRRERDRAAREPELGAAARHARGRERRGSAPVDGRRARVDGEPFTAARPSSRSPSSRLDEAVLQSAAGRNLRRAAVGRAVDAGGAGAVADARLHGTCRRSACEQSGPPGSRVVDARARRAALARHRPTVTVPAAARRGSATSSRRRGDERGAPVRCEHATADNRGPPCGGSQIVRPPWPRQPYGLRARLRSGSSHGPCRSRSAVFAAADGRTGCQRADNLER